MIAKELPNNAFLRELQLDDINWSVSELKWDTTEEKKNVSATAMSVINGLRENMTLHVLRLNDPRLRFFDTARRMPFYQHLNQNCKRSQLLRGEQPVPSSYWYFILEKFNLMPSVVFYYLTELPDMMVARGKRIQTHNTSDPTVGLNQLCQKEENYAKRHKSI
jgi:hypothetical protein